MTIQTRHTGRIASTVGCLLALILGAAVHAQTVELRVDGDSGDVPPPFGNADGSDWGPLAFKFLQDALAEADSLEPTPENPVQIWVAATVETNPYRPDRDAANPDGSGLHIATFNLINNVEIYGGFLGTDRPVAPETQLSQRDPENNETVLSGDLLGNDGGLTLSKTTMRTATTWSRLTTLTRPVASMDSPSPKDSGTVAGPMRTPAAGCLSSVEVSQTSMQTRS